MAQPPEYVRQFDFEDFSTNYPTTPHQGVKLELEFDAIKTTSDAVRTNLALIQADNGNLKNAIVGIDQLKAEVTFALNAVTNWLTATSYDVNDGVWQTRKLYRCLVKHTSGTFSTDLGNAYWELLVDHDQWLTAGEAAQAAAEAAQTAAEAAQTNAETAETNAGTQATNASNSAASAAANATVASLWATEAEDVVVSGGEYSAKHYAAKAQGYAAAVNLPSISPGDAGKHLTVNPGETGYVYEAPPTVPTAANATETTAGTDAAKFVTPDALAGSDYGTVQVSIWLTSIGGSLATGDGKNYWDVPSHLAGFNIIAVSARAEEAGVTGSTTIQIHNKTQAADILSSLLTILTTANNDDGTAAIDAAEDDLTAGDVIRFDVDSVSTGTAPKSVRVNMILRKP